MTPSPSLSIPEYLGPPTGLEFAPGSPVAVITCGVCDAWVDRVETWHPEPVFAGFDPARRMTDQWHRLVPCGHVVGGDAHGVIYVVRASEVVWEAWGQAGHSA